MGYREEAWLTLVHVFRQVKRTFRFELAQEHATGPSDVCFSARAQLIFPSPEETRIRKGKV